MIHLVYASKETDERQAQLFGQMPDSETWTSLANAEANTGRCATS